VKIITEGPRQWKAARLGTYLGIPEVDRKAMGLRTIRAAS
jgi:hypothetical protein